jgi:hypothetical protein
MSPFLQAVRARAFTAVLFFVYSGDFPMIHHYLRLVTLQDYCFRTKKRKWAKALGIELKAFLADNPQFKGL